MQPHRVVSNRNLRHSEKGRTRRNEMKQKKKKREKKRRKQKGYEAGNQTNDQARLVGGEKWQLE